jgi:hypothetical protein
LCNTHTACFFVSPPHHPENIPQMGSTKNSPRPTMGPVLHGVYDTCPQSPHVQQCTSFEPPHVRAPQIDAHHSSDINRNFMAAFRRFAVVLLVSICILIIFGWIGVPGEGPAEPHCFRTPLINRESSLFTQSTDETNSGYFTSPSSQSTDQMNSGSFTSPSSTQSPLEHTSKVTHSPTIKKK